MSATSYTTNGHLKKLSKNPSRIKRLSQKRLFDYVPSMHVSKPVLALPQSQLFPLLLPPLHIYTIYQRGVMDYLHLTDLLVRKVLDILHQ